MLSGRYRVDEIIGRGGMATVYRGEDLTLGREVAIKILDPSLASDSVFRTRFRLEAQAASRMSHPAIVRVFDAGEDTDTDPDGAGRPVPYIVMELVRGRLLKDVLADGPMSVTDAVREVDGILEALEYAHRAGVVHRDIKPGNVMVTPEGQIKVMDFGIARAVSDSSATMAETTAIIGTASYLSPEQAKGDPVDARADLYSVGIVLYELLTGVPPFRADSPLALAYQHVSETPRPPSELRGDVPRSLDALVLRALAKDPSQRPQTAADFRRELEAALEGNGPSRRRVETMTQHLYGAHPGQSVETARSLEQLSTDTTMRRTQSGPPASWVWAGVTLLAVIIVSVLVWVVAIQPTDTMPANSRAIPDVVTMSWERAEQVLTQADLTPVRAEEPSEETPAGSVTRTDPVAGTTVEPGQRVTVYVSTGVETTAVPTVAALSLAEATAALEQAGLSLGVVTRRSDPDRSADTVLSARSGSTEVSAGDPLPRGSAVDLVVATGTVSVDDFAQNYSVDKAVEILKSDALKLVPVVQEDPSCPATDPRMVKVQSLVGEVPIHSEITLVVCSGS